MSIFCGFPSSNTSKSSRVSPVMKLPGLIGDDGVDIDVVDLDLKGDHGRTLRILSLDDGRLKNRDRAASRISSVSWFHNSDL